MIFVLLFLALAACWFVDSKRRALLRQREADAEISFTEWFNGSAS